MPRGAHAESCIKRCHGAAARRVLYFCILCLIFANACFSQQRNHNKATKQIKTKTTSANKTHNSITTCKSSLTTPTVCASYCAKFIFRDSFRMRPSPQDVVRQVWKPCNLTSLRGTLHVRFRQACLSAVQFHLTTSMIEPET